MTMLDGSLTLALVEAVKALGGSKVVGCKLWPEKAPDAAQRLLLDCLNDDRHPNRPRQRPLPRHA